LNTCCNLQTLSGARTMPAARSVSSMIWCDWFLPSSCDLGWPIKAYFRLPRAETSAFLTASPGSVLFSRSYLLKRKGLCFSCLRLGLIRHRRSLKILTPFLKWVPRFYRVITRASPARPHLGVRLMASSLSASLFTAVQVPLIYH